jgi:hypothetical protein
MFLEAAVTQTVLCYDAFVASTEEVSQNGCLMHGAFQKLIANTKKNHQSMFVLVMFSFL